MILQDLLTDLRENILHDRSDRIDGSADYLWSDTTLVRYINEAQRRFAVKGFVIRDDSTAAVVNVTLATGVTQYELHKSVIAVVSARISTSDVDLQRLGHSVLGAYTNNSSMSWDPSIVGLSPGSPVGYSTDETLGEDGDSAVSAVVLRVYPAPSAAANGTIIKLRVVRKPINQLTMATLTASPEIPVDHHIEMLDWAAYLALRIVDQDAGSPKRAAEFRDMFEIHVAEARKLVLRKMFVPRRWGFGRGGFSWGASG